jgi:hypothetical protein
MNRLLTNKGSKFIGILKLNTACFRLLATLPIFVFSSLIFSSLVFSAVVYAPPASANRPAMDEGAEMDSEANATEAPSSVDIMMQHETRHSGDVLQMPAKEIQPGETIQIKLLDYPRRGMSMGKVQQEYGQPIAISDTVGEPPITRWIYQDRVVYFERSTVLHVVAR